MPSELSWIVDLAPYLGSPVATVVVLLAWLWYRRRNGLAEHVHDNPETAASLQRMEVQLQAMKDSLIHLLAVSQANQRRLEDVYQELIHRHT